MDTFGQLYDIVYNIGGRNIEIAKSMLAEKKIPIKSINVGGPYGRKLLFHTKTGEVLLKFLKTNVR